VDIAFFLDQRLKFVEYFYANASSGFEEIQRRIEADEPPYVDTRGSHAGTVYRPDQSPDRTAREAVCGLRRFELSGATSTNTLHTLIRRWRSE
jgi:hypothetical protein